MELGLWHDVWAAVAAPAIGEAVGSAGIPLGGCVLDLGTGGGVALGALAHAVGPGGAVLGIDADPASAGIARERANGIVGGARLHVRSCDVDTILREGVRFDAVWAADVLWRNYFEDPARAVARVVECLAPHGVLAVFTGNWYSSRFLHGHPDLERRIQWANARRWGVPPDGAASHHEQSTAWMREAGLEIAVTMHPLAGSAASPGWPAWRRYLQVAVWPEYLAAAQAHGREAGMTTAELDELAALVTPDGARYLPDQPGFVAFQPALLAVGRK